MSSPNFLKRNFLLKLSALPVLAGLSLGLANQANAQNRRSRPFPAHAWRGTMVVTAPPSFITIDKKPQKLSPGSRIRGTHNLIVFANTLVGQELIVNYTLEANTGMVNEVWILTPEEAKVKRLKRPDK